MSTTASDAEAPSTVIPDDVLALEARIATYLAPEQVESVRRAYLIGAHAHRAQTRKSGEPYITHPVAVAAILADLGMDGETLLAAILHDTLEDTELTRPELVAEFGETVAELVDGVTKLDGVKFRTRQEAAAESFRKMLLAMARDLRVILIKLADRLHNMRTLGAMAPDSRRRIARETLEIYAPIAHRLGMNRFRSELQDLGFRALYPDRYRVIAGKIRKLVGDDDQTQVRRRVEHEITARLDAGGISHRVVSRVKAPYGVYMKMLNDHKSFAEVIDVNGFRVVVDRVRDCYHALGVIHALYKPLDGRFKDFIAIPKANGYQSLHTVVFGPAEKAEKAGKAIEVQIRTDAMNNVAERGIAAHWAYKSGVSGGSGSAQSRAREWLSTMADGQKAMPSSLEFIENVKVDLFPDEVYAFTPKGRIFDLPRNSTALDFAYAVHTHVGDHAVAARLDTRLVPLRTRLSSGQMVEIITAKSAAPSPQWLDWVVSGKARTAIRHHLKRLQHEDAIDFGHRMLDRALDALGASLEIVRRPILEQYLTEHRYKRLEELLSDIALGNVMADHVAHGLLVSQGHPEASNRISEKIQITGSERGVLSFANCCHPVPGDEIMGYLTTGKGIVVHRIECPNVPEFRKSSQRCVEIAWDRDVVGDYKVELRIGVGNHPGVLAQVASAIAQTGANIENVEYQERDLMTANLVFTIEVLNRKHLANVMRGVRRLGVVNSVHRHPL